MTPPSWMSTSAFEHHVVGTAATSNADVAHVYAAGLTPSISRRLHESGIEVHANDAMNAQHMRGALAAGADRLSTYDVELALHTLEHND